MLCSAVRWSRNPRFPMLTLLASAEIRLMPDKTLFVQLAIFLVVAIALNYLVFKPVLKILNLRYSKTKGDKAKIEDLTVKADALIKEYEAKMKQAKVESLQMKEAIRREGESQGQKIVHESKQAALTQIEKIKEEIAFEGKRAAASLEEQAKNLSKELAQKVLGRPIDKIH